MWPAAADDLADLSEQYPPAARQLVANALADIAFGRQTGTPPTTLPGQPPLAGYRRITVPLGLDTASAALIVFSEPDTGRTRPTVELLAVLIAGPLVSALQELDTVIDLDSDSQRRRRRERLNAEDSRLAKQARQQARAQAQTAAGFQPGTAAAEGVQRRAPAAALSTAPTGEAVLLASRVAALSQDPSVVLGSPELVRNVAQRARRIVQDAAVTPGMTPQQLLRTAAASYEAVAKVTPTANVRPAASSQRPTTTSRSGIAEATALLRSTVTAIQPATRPSHHQDRRTAPTARPTTPSR